MSPERQALASLIVEREELQKRERVLSTAKAAADRAVWAASGEVDAAKAALQETGEQAIARLLAEAAGEAQDGPSAAAAARLRVSEAEMALVDARLARDALEERLRQPGGSGFGDMRLRDAALAVVAAEAGPHARGLVERVSELRRDLARASREFRWLAQHGALPVEREPGDRFGKPVDDTARTLLWRTDPQYVNRDDDLNAPALRADGPWIAALDALQLDAAAPLPVSA